MKTKLTLHGEILGVRFFFFEIKCTLDMVFIQCYLPAWDVMFFFSCFSQLLFGQ
jgi:hypothetical protein